MTPQKSNAGVAKVALNLEVHIIPVSDVERAKKFYQLLGWRLDEDVSPAKNIRIVQFTPPGSGCSVNFGTGISGAAPGSAAAALSFVLMAVIMIVVIIYIRFAGSEALMGQEAV